MKDNKGFWDRWAKRYDFMMSGDGRTYAQIVSRMKKVLDREITVLEPASGTGFLSVRLAGNVKLLEANGFFGRDDTAGKSTQFPHPFLGVGCGKPCICGGK